MHEHPEGIFGVVVGELVRFSNELRNDPRFRFFTERDIGRKPVGVDNIRVLIVITGFTRHDVIAPITQRAKKRGIPIFHIETTQKFTQLVERVFPAAPAQSPSPPPEPPAPPPTPPPTPEPKAQPRTMSKLIPDERRQLFASLAKEFHDHGGTLTKMAFGEFLRTHPLNLKAGAFSLWLRAHNYLEVAGTGKGGKAGRWKPGSALTEFVENLQSKEQPVEAPAPSVAPTVPTPTAGVALQERIAALERERAALREELDRLITAKKQELAELEAEKAKLG